MLIRQLSSSYLLLSFITMLLWHSQLSAQCEVGDCTYWPDPGQIYITGHETTGDHGYPLIRLDDKGNILDDLTIEVLSKKDGSCTLDPEDTTTSYGGGVGCGLDNGDDDKYRFTIERLIGDASSSSSGRVINLHENSRAFLGPKTMRFRANLEEVFPISGIYKVTRSFSSNQCHSNENGCGIEREATVLLEAEVVFTGNDANTFICFDLPEDRIASATAADTQEYWAGNGFDACGFQQEEVPTTDLNVCSKSEIPGILVFGTTEYCNLQDSRLEKLSPNDESWVEFRTGETAGATRIRNQIDQPGTYLFRRRDLRNDIWSETNILSITLGAAPPSSINIYPLNQAICEGVNPEPFSLVTTIPTDYPVTYRWQKEVIEVIQNSDGVEVILERWEDIDGATSTTFTPPTDARDETYRLVIALDSRDPLIPCSYSPGELWSKEVTFTRTEGDGVEYARDFDGDGYATLDAARQVLCSPEPGWVLPSDLTDCDETATSRNINISWYEDADQDGIVDVYNPRFSCIRPTATSIKADDVTSWAHDCDDNDNSVQSTTLWYKDADHDGYADGIPAFRSCHSPGFNYKLESELTSLAIDCNDDNGRIHPESIWYLDADYDGHGSAADMYIGCSPPEDYVVSYELASTEDCDDSDPNLSLLQRFYEDQDNDGYPSLNTNTGLAAVSQLRCTPNTRFTKTESELKSLTPDCDDDDPSVHPSTLWYPDRDGDGFGNSFVIGTASCTNPDPNFINNRTDCNDNNANSPCSLFLGRGKALQTTAGVTIQSIHKDLGNFGTEDFTIELWFKTSKEENSLIMSKGIPGGGFLLIWVIAIIDNQLKVASQAQGGIFQVIETTTEVNDGKWHHMIYRRRGQRFSLFLDGIREADEVQSYPFNLVSDTVVSIGGDQDLVNEGAIVGAFEGELDEIRIWNLARTTKELELTRHVALTGSEEGLAASWQFRNLWNYQSQLHARDKVGGNNLKIIEGAQLVDSTIPFGPGVSGFAEFVPGVTDGNLDFDEVELVIEDANITEDLASVAITQIDELPSEASDLPGQAAQQAHYVVSLLEVGAQEMNGDFLVNNGKGNSQGQGQAGGVVQTIDEYYLFQRDTNGENPWELISTTRTSRDGFAIFPNVLITSGQYFVTFTSVEVESPIFKRGDVDTNGTVDITDAISNLSFLFLGTFDPPCMEAADADNSGLADLSDAINILSYLFLGLGTPASPGPTQCGPDIDDVFLGCESYTNC